MADPDDHKQQPDAADKLMKAFTPATRAPKFVMDANHSDVMH